MVVTTWSQIRTLHERLGKTEYEDKFSINNIQDENNHLKERIDELILNENHLVELNKELQRKIQEHEYQPRRSNSSSSGSNSSNETVITPSTQKKLRNFQKEIQNSEKDYTDLEEKYEHEKLRNLQNEIENFKKEYGDLEEKYEYEKHELQTMVEQLREDNVDLDKTKQLYIDVCQEKNTIEDKLRSKFELELNTKLDDLHRNLEKEYNENILYYKNNQEVFEQEKQRLRIKHNQELEQQSREARQDMDRIKVKHEKQINELNNQLDRLKTNDDAKSRLIYIEREYEQLKHDYYDLNLKQKELLITCSTLENENRHLINTLEQIEQEKLELKQRFENEEEKLLHEIKQLNELNDHQKQELISIHRQTDHHELNLKQDIESLQIRINNYENAVSQYEEYRVKLENNLQKISQQRDTNKMDLRLTKEMLTNKEDEFNQLKLRFNECEKHLQNNRERFVQYDTNINDLERQIKLYEQENQQLSQTRLEMIQDKEIEYREKLISLNAEKCEYDQRLKEANRALDLADSHLQQEIEKIKVSLEQEYNRRYERDQKQHQNDLNQLRKQLTTEFDKQRASISPIHHQSNTSAQDLEEMKKMYRTEIDRLYRENIELSQHQAKLIDTHQKQMQIMKKELDDGYNNVINEFQHEQTRLQTRYDQLKQQLNDAQQIIEQLKTNLNELKTNHFDDMSKIKESHTNEKYTFEHDNKTNQKDLQTRLEHLVKLLEQSNDALNHERTLHAKQENEYQQSISSLQKKIADMTKQHTKAMDEVKHELHQKRVTIRPTSVPEFVQTDVSVNDMKLEYMATVEKLRVGIAHFMDNLEVSIKKQIQNELIRSRNSMIKEIRRELFEKITHALRSQGVPDTTIDMHVFELDRLLSQMAQDCSDSLTTSSSSSSSSSSILSFQITPQRQQIRSVNNDISSSTKPTTPLRKSIECLYMTPTINKQPAPLAPHCHLTLDNDRRPKSASNVLIASQYSTTTTILSPRTHKFQRLTHKNSKMKTHRSEDDIMLAIQRNEQQKSNLNRNYGDDDDDDDDDDDTSTLCETEKEDPPSVRALAKQFEQKPNFLPDHSRQKSATPDIHYATARTIINDHKEDNDDELTWPQQPQSPTVSSQSSGIKKFVRNGLKLFLNQPQQQQQHKRTGK